MSKFEDLQLAGCLLRALKEKGYETATPIQADAIPPIIKGSDLVGCAQTGTGKTAAFALPTLHRLLTTGQRNRPGGKKRKLIRALVLAPTRELSAQIGESFAAYSRFSKLRHAVIFGGVSQHPQVRKLRAGIDTLIATPGRLLDLIEQGHVDLSHVEVLIFDEADQMLDMGFLPDLRKIEHYCPDRRQTLMFSATMPPEIRKLAEEWLHKPVNIQTARVSAPAAKVQQSVYFVERRQKGRLLEQFLNSSAGGRTLVFSRTKHGADKIVKFLQKGKIRAAAIHGNKSQSARQRALEQFKSKSPPVLVATDIAARGLDISDVSHVINYDLPETPETYVHRIGRTARAGASGNAVSFVTSDDVFTLRGIEKLTRRQIDIALDYPELTSDIAPAPTVAQGKSFRRGGAKPGWKKSGKPNSGTAGRNSKSSGKRKPRVKTKTEGKTSAGKVTVTNADANGPSKPRGAKSAANGGKPTGKPKRRRRRPAKQK